jgi:hypothetical protein
MQLANKKIDLSYDIPYTAGYSKDGKIIYIDRKLPQIVESRYYNNIPIDLHKYLLHHELIEKTLIDEFSYSYLYAHRLALAAEVELLHVDNIDVDAYYGLSQKYYDFNAQLENITSVPLDLDLRPYVEDGRFDIVEHVINLQLAEKKGKV